MSRLRTAATGQLDVEAAVTRSMLGWGVAAGPLYLVTGLTLAATRDGFDPTEHPLSLLMLGKGGWMQRTNLIVVGALVLVAAIGMARALRYVPPPSRAATAVAVLGSALIASGVFAPDPAAGFPPGSTEEVTIAGVLHLAFGAVQFAAATAAAAMFSRWARANGRTRAATAARLMAIVIATAFVGGAALASTPAGTALMWIAVVTEFLWLAAASVHLWGVVPHPDISRRSVDSSRRSGPRS